MKWKNIGTRTKEFADDFAQFFEENNIIHGEIFKTDEIWRVPYMAIGKEQNDKVETFLEQRIEEDKV